MSKNKESVETNETEKIDEKVAEKVEVKMTYIAECNIMYGEVAVKMGEEFEVANEDVIEFIEKGIIKE